VSKFIIILILLLNINLYSNNNALSDTTCFTQEEVINLSLKFQELEYKVSTYEKLIGQYQIQIMNYETLRMLDSINLDKSEFQIQILEDNNELLKQQIEETRPEWYESPYFGFGIGALIVTIITFGVR